MISSFKNKLIIIIIIIIIIVERAQKRSDLQNITF